MLFLTRLILKFVCSKFTAFISDYECQEDIQSLAHNKLGEVVSILKGVIQRYPTLNPTEILTSAGIVIKKVKEHDYSSLDEPNGFFEAIDQLALAFSNRYETFAVLFAYFDVQTESSC